MIIKIEFEIKINFKEGESYAFKSPSSSQEFKYLGESRIDGYPVFLFDECEMEPSESLRDFTYNKIGKESLELVTNLSDHIPNNHYDNNRKEIYDFLKEELSFDDIDLYGEGAAKNIIRRFKLKSLLRK